MAAWSSLREPLVNRVSWGALFAGFFVGFALWLVLLALGAGIGLAAFDPRDLGSWQGLGIGFGIWGIIAAIISVFLAAFLTARLSAADERTAGVLHGVALWGFMLVAGLWIASMAVQRVAAGAGGAIQSAASAASGAAGQASGTGAGQQVVDDLTRGATAQLNDWLRQQGMSEVTRPQLEAAMRQIVGGATARIRQGDSPAQALDRESITQALAQNTNLTAEEANRAAAQVQSQLQGQLGQAQQQLAQAGETAAGVGQVSAWGFFGYGVLTLLAAAFGGAAGVPRGRRIVAREETAPVPPAGAPLRPQRA